MNSNIDKIGNVRVT